MINYLYDLLLYIINNSELITLLVFILLGLSCFFILKIKRTLKNKKELGSNNNNSSSNSSESIGAYAKPHNKYYVPEHSTEHNHSSNFFAESVSQVFENKTHKRSR